VTAVLKLTARVLVVGSACALMLPLPALASTKAAAKSPCWVTLLNDWYDGRIDNVYPIPCYREAIKHLPTDISVYSSAREDIQRALQLAINYKKHPKTAPKPFVKSRTPPAPSSSSGSSSGSSSSGGATSTPAPGNKPSPGIPTALKNSSPGGATSFPLPLIILGGLALFLLAAGAVGLIIRRMQGRGPGAGGPGPSGPSAA
jgi:hypothetical protein